MNRSENDIILARRGICQRQVAAYLGTDRLRGHVIPAGLILSLDLHEGHGLSFVMTRSFPTRIGTATSR